MIVGACGFGSTGSSVVSDYLNEYDDVCTLDGIEFTWVSCTDGLVDLKIHVMQPHNRTSDSIKAITRYYDAMYQYMRYYEKCGNLNRVIFKDSVDKFIESITTVTWNGYVSEKKSLLVSKFRDSIMKQRVIPFIEKKIGRRTTCYPMKKVRLSILPDDFDEKAKRHVKELLSGMGADFSKTIVLDQPFSGNNPQACFPFFEDPYAIVVDRDPRDNYVFSRTKLLGRNHFMATEPVEDFIKYYRALREDQPYKENNDRILCLQFEDMVYNYDATTKKLREFLRLPNNPHPKSVFDPELSINNTQVWKRFNQFTEDIHKIEDSLPEYLYDFKKYGERKIDGEMFFGKSPLHQSNLKVN